MNGGQWNQPPRHEKRGRFRWDRLILVIVFGGLILYGMVKFIGYGIDLLSSALTSRELQQVYHNEEPTETVAPVITEIPATAPPATAMPIAAVTLAPTANPVLSTVKYPANPDAQISQRFKALRKENKDIVGWLMVNTLLDEPVVQRDEVVYMDHDALGKKNVNGAIFLDSSMSLKTRPYALVLYGHNMKTGAMFGSLRNFENISFYHNNPFIRLDTMYEDGAYVIFAVGSISMEPRTRHYVDFFDLSSNRVRERQTAIDALIAASVYTCPLDVQTDDQLLILITCTEKDSDRRMVAARRIRDGENEDALKERVSWSRKK